MDGRKLLFIIVKAMFFFLALLNIAVFFFFGTTVLYAVYAAHTENLENYWVNPIRDETFQVDLDLDAEGRSYHITRAYKCSDVHELTRGNHVVQRTVFANQRIISQHLPSGNIVFITVPDGCRPIWQMRVLHVPCEQSNAFFIGSGHPRIDCRSKWPVISNHIPLVYWTKDTGYLKSLIVYMDGAAFSSDGSSVKRATAVVTIKKGLTESSPDEYSWLGERTSSAVANHGIKFFGYVAFKDKACGIADFDWRLHAFGLGAPLPTQPELCMTPFDRDGNAIEKLRGLFVLHSDPESVSQPAIEFANAPVSAADMIVPSSSKK